MIPGMDGLQICRPVREANKVLYIILLTARGGKERLVEGLQAGADDYLMKPFDKDELRARLQVGARIIALHMTLAARVQDVRDSLFEDAVPLIGRRASNAIFAQWRARAVGAKILQQIRSPRLAKAGEEFELMSRAAGCDSGSLILSISQGKCSPRRILLYSLPPAAL